MALVAGFAGPGLSAQPAAARPGIQPLPAHLEAIRAQEAIKLYGSPSVRPIDQRKTSLITVGDSEISGEGAGNYEPGTHQDGNWCDRSRDQAVWRVDIAANTRYNLSCSGAQPAHLIAGSGRFQWNELNQGDNLAIKARNTKVKLIWLVVGANGPDTIEFTPVATDCVARRFFFVGTCWATYTDQWTARIDGTRQQIESVVTSVRTTMRNAGYDQRDYELVLQSYPGPVSPDVEDNPRFPGWYHGGCVVYLADAAFARNKAVPMFERAVRAAATNTGTRYLDASRLFHGHEVCTEDPMVRGLYIELGVWDQNAVRQSMHPNARGHAAFAECMTQFYDSGQARATCVDPASTGRGRVTPGLMEFKQLRNLGTEGCVDGEGYNSRLNTVQLSYGCHGGRNQAFWYDPSYRSLHSELNHDRCLDIAGGAVAAAGVKVHNCDGAANQKWSFVGERIHPATNTRLCLGLTYPFLGIGAPTLRVSACDRGDERQRWAFEARRVSNPVGYGYSDYIGTAVY